jgi:cytochrome bd-type quinol oxidase subunit 2
MEPKTTSPNSSRAPKINRMAARIAIALSVIALLCVLSGYFQPPQADEGSASHTFQISIALLFLTLILFLTTADWKRPAKSIRALGLPAAALAIAFAALFYLEHYR